MYKKFKKRYARRGYKKNYFSRKRKRSYKKYSRKIPSNLPTICKQKHKLEMEFTNSDVDGNVYPSNASMPFQFAGNDVNNPLRGNAWPVAMRNRVANGVNHFYALYTHGWCSGFKVKVTLQNITEYDEGNVEDLETTLYILGMHPHRADVNPIAVNTDTGRRTFRENNFYINTCVPESQEQGSYKIGHKQYISVKKFFNRQTKDDDSVQAEAAPLVNDDCVFYSIITRALTDKLATIASTTVTDKMGWRMNVKLTQYIEWTRAFKIRVPDT